MRDIYNSNLMRFILPAGFRRADDNCASRASRDEHVGKSKRDYEGCI